ncbi:MULTISPECIES: Arm DNA-binding domain-containing protein [Bradyrhizobium]|uniref:DUF4102 domain-containing protein n=1 Tax=Bradyrhizobium diversitatis TaxID=2755406 RepID=A0ABS0PCW6_9BRAD|nr:MULTISPECIES: Arm DNA-binding domain-containing protein [Bradyrhizobium]MBH5391071.1 DUF4102 domain-containing protein [Bradyrhizobium diversitatis]UPJ64193.1 DUF4102 domain-containing protein [Bradyrhizobium sp. 191]
MKAITTDVQVRNLKAAAEDYRRTVGGNLYLLIKTNGSKLWRYDYKVGTRKTLAIGAYPEVSLSDAMTARDNAPVSSSAALIRRTIAIRSAASPLLQGPSSSASRVRMSNMNEVHQFRTLVELN